MSSQLHQEIPQQTSLAKSVQELSSILLKNNFKIPDDIQSLLDQYMGQTQTEEIRIELLIWIEEALDQLGMTLKKESKNLNYSLDPQIDINLCYKLQLIISGITKIRALITEPIYVEVDEI